MSYMRLGDNIDPNDLAKILGDLQNQIAAFDAAWDSTIGTTVPPQFVMDLGQNLLSEVVTPFTDLRIEMAADPENFSISGFIRAAGSTGDVMWQDRVLPVLLEAIEAKRAGAASMVIPADLKQRIIGVMTFYRTGYVQLWDALDEKSWWQKLGIISTLAIKFLGLASRALTSMKKWLTTHVYDPVNDAIDTVATIMKVSLVAGAAYVAYQLLGKPRQNPARRRGASSWRHRTRRRR